MTMNFENLALKKFSNGKYLEMTARHNKIWWMELSNACKKDGIFNRLTQKEEKNGKQMSYTRKRTRE